MALTRRIGNYQPFARVAARDDDRYQGMQAGIISYAAQEDGSEAYQVSYAELGGRSDHLADPLTQLFDGDVTRLTTDAPLSSDADLLRNAPTDEKPATLKVVA